MFETTKMFIHRIKNDDYMYYVNGDILDVGCGNDLVNSPYGTAVPYDLAQGDGQYLTGIVDGCFDSVHSSHSLEHMKDVDEAIKNWARVLKDKGNMFIVVPDFDLYEKGIFPSRSNSDHKHTFSINKTRQEVGRDNHYNICLDLMPILNKYNCKVKIIRLEDYNFDYNDLTKPERQDATYQIVIVARKGTLA